MRPGREITPLFRVVIDGDRNIAITDLEEIHKRVPLCARAVRPDHLAARDFPVDELPELPLVEEDALRESAVRFPGGDAERGLALEILRDPGCALVFAPPAHIRPDCSPVKVCEVLHIEHIHLMHAHQGHQRSDADVREMFVIRRIELVLPDKVEDVGAFDDKYSPAGQAGGHPFHKLVDIVHMRKDIGRRDHHGVAEPRSDVFGDGG